MELVQHLQRNGTDVPHDVYWHADLLPLVGVKTDTVNKGHSEASEVSADKSGLKLGEKLGSFHNL